MNISFYNGISGIKSQQFGIDVISNNITNINTSGFKASYAEFSTVFSSKLSNALSEPTSNDIGLSTTINSISTDFSQGTFIKTDSKYDMAINGKGWFGLIDKHNNLFYTRSGSFNLDANGDLVDTNGFYVVGTSANNIQNGRIIENPNLTIKLTDPYNQQKINFTKPLILPSQPTSYVTLQGNLNPKIIKKFDPTTGEFQEKSNIEVFQVNVIDKNGNDNLLKITFTKQVPQAKENIIWNAKAEIFDQNKNIINTSTGILNFNSKGSLISNTLTSINNNGVDIALNFGSNYDGLVSFLNADVNRVIEKDGSKESNIQDYIIDEDGNVIANFQNGKNIPIAKIAIFNFQNENGLNKVGQTYFQESPNSKKALFLTNSNATIKTNNLEMSNVSLSKALTELLVMQKAFDANSKSITTSDQLIQNAINMKK